MMKELKAAQDVFQRYVKVNRETLGRKDDLSRVQVDRQFLAEHCRLMYQLDQVRQAPSSNDLVQNVQNSLEPIFRMIYNGLPYIIEDCFAQSSRIAKDLGKPAPLLSMQVVDIPVPQAIEDVLRKISVHLVRNALDHGIESAEERTRAGKPPVGNMSILAEIRDEQLYIRLKDDGRGLAIGKLKERALPGPHHGGPVDIQAIANTIFDDGISTSQTVSQVSGRGVGMASVKRFVEEVSGQIEIVLGEKVDAAGKYYQFEIIMLFPCRDFDLSRLPHEAVLSSKETA